MKELLTELKKNFCIEEFVDKQVAQKYGERAWRFFDPRLLETMWIVRTALDKSITINNWKWGGPLQQRGLRTNVSQIVQSKNLKKQLYLSAHLRGAAVDFDVEGMTAPEVRGWLKTNEEILPHKIRLENKLGGRQISWCHLDVDYEEKNPHVYLFDV